MSNPIFNLEIPNQPRSLRVVAAALRSAMEELGFSKADIHHLELAVDEACTNVLEHAYPKGVEDLFQVQCFLEMGRLIVRVRDQGIPFDPFQTPGYQPGDPQSKGLGSFLMRRNTDELRYLNLGREGKAFDLIKHLPLEIPPGRPESAGPSREEELPAPPLEVRLFRPEDAAQVARCAWFVYGYSYLGEHLYRPEQLIEMNRVGELVSAVAASAEGEIFGHAALIFQEAAGLPESGQALVLPRARGQKVFQRLKSLLLQCARERHCPGVYSEAVTAHPYSQKANISLGSRECGLLLGYAAQTLDFKGFGLSQSTRQAVMLFFSPLSERLVSDVCFPPHHRDMLRRIYAHMGIEARELPAGGSGPDDSTQVKVSCSHLWGFAFLAVERYGGTVVADIQEKLRQLCLDHIAVVYLDLPLSDPSTALLCTEFEQLGFVFAGVIPRLRGEGDTLRLQYLNNVPVKQEEIHLASDFGRELLGYVLGQLGLLC